MWSFFRKILLFHFQNFAKFDAATNVLQKVALPFLDAEACNVHFDNMNHTIQICSGAEKGMFHFYLQLNLWLKDISTPDFSTMNSSTMNFPTRKRKGTFQHQNFQL